MRRIKDRADLIGHETHEETPEALEKESYNGSETDNYLLKQLKKLP